MKLLFISNLFPDLRNPQRGLHNARLLQALARFNEIEVIAPRPELPSFTRQPPAMPPEGSLAAFNPVYPIVHYLPKIGSLINHRLYACGMRSAIREKLRHFPAEACLAAWVYPDGCAAIALAAEAGLPVAVIAQGSDIHHYLRMPWRRRVILRYLHRADAVITRSADLAAQLQKAGLSPAKLQSIYNGVDTDFFRPGSRQAAREWLNLPQEDKIALFVGNLVPVKNPLLAVAALAELRRRQSGRSWRLILVGAGPLKGKIEQAAKAAGIADRVSLIGEQSPAEVMGYMQAADLLCVPSENEGVPNVIREALACGLPVVATRVGGIPEIMTRPALGKLVAPGDAGAMATAWEQTIDTPTDSHVLRDYAATFSWDRTVEQYQAVLSRLTAGR